MQFSSSDVHIMLSLLAGVILLLVAVISLMRDKTARINQLFSLFFLFGAIRFLSDSILVWIADQGEDVGSPELYNFFRDFIVGSLILSLALGSYAVYKIFYGDSINYSDKSIVVSFLIFILTFILSIFGDFVKSEESNSHTHSHGFTVQRESFGWIGIIIALIFFSAIISYYIYSLYIVSDPELQNRLLRLFGGFAIVLITFFLFDIAEFVEEIEKVVIQNDFGHFLLHLLTISGAIIILSTFWTPLTKKN
ncbi:MAG: hypothetical protein ACXAC7_08275 [Candidatus Hodarchaeales archaeon]